jgi:cytochrome P450
VTRYDDVVQVLRDPDAFSNAGRVLHLLDQLPDEQQERASYLRRHYSVGIGHSDPPSHTRLRELVAPAFAPRQIAALRPRISAIAEILLNRAQDDGGAGALDGIADLAYPLPAMVALALLGAPTSDMHLFRRWALDINLLFAGGARVDPQAAITADRSLMEMRAYLLALIEDRRRCPCEDIISHLVHSETEDRLDEQELISTCVTLFVAGHETTTNVLGNGLAALLQRPPVLAALRADPGAIPACVEEMLRFDAPVQRAWRMATRDVSMAGARIRRREMVLAMLGAANHDPARFTNPDAFDIHRREQRHLGFGLGIHFCLGAPLARLEVEIALHTLLLHFREIELDSSQELRWRRDVALRGVESLPLLVS